MQAAFLVFLAAAAGAWIVAADGSQRVPGGLARREQRRRRRIARSLALLLVFFREAVPGGQLLDGIAEQRVFVAVAPPWLRRVQERECEIVLEVLIAEPARMDDLAIEGLL